MNNPLQPQACEIISVKKQGGHEFTFRVKSDAKPLPGQFMQLSLPKIGECPISVSGYGEGWLEFTIRSVGEVTNIIFEKQPGDLLFLRGPYGKGWPIEGIKGKNVVVVSGGTGLAPVRELLNMCADEQGFSKSTTLICGFKDETGIVFSDDLDRWKTKFRTIYALDKDEKSGWRVGMVTKFIKEVDFKGLGDDYALIVVGPPIMMKYACQEALACGAKEENMWLSFERKMSCAIGKCGHCRIDETYVCLDGPVFPYKVAKNLVD
ncbi:MAG: anaerobic sulfite reductase subunit AsrB [Firmicutes bacterium HGW-Firmicutes-16]|nr:MAG: anaerobic sulfite reductase subunit AsrB [Firmicutes bacterium HGW-Firmicutes-16]